MNQRKSEKPPLVTTGIAGFDEILGGGLPAGQTHLLQGGVGTGKTTLALEFARAGAAAGEPVLFLTLSQSAGGLRQIARSHGWELEGIEIVELSRRNVAAPGAQQQDVFHSAAVELGEVTGAIHGALDRIKPARLVLDSVSALRVLAAGAGARYRDEVLALLGRLEREQVTVLFVQNPEPSDLHELPAMVTGVVELEIEKSVYGSNQRTLRVRKMRGLDIATGSHNFTIKTGAVEVYPRLDQPAADGQRSELAQLSSGVAGLDEMLMGGLEEGTAAVLVGATGTGKTTTATLYIHAALERGERAAAFLFDERQQTFLTRAAGLGLDLRAYLEKGQFELFVVDTGDLSPGEMAHHIREVVDRGATVVVLDSITGYFHSMGRKDLLIAQLHEMLAYMSRHGVLSILVVAQHGMVGRNISSPVDVSYMADSVLLLRNFESVGRVRRALSVVKKRHSDHEKTIRELRITGDGVEVGAPITDFQGILSGRPRYLDGEERLGQERADGPDDA